MTVLTLFALSLKSPPLPRGGFFFRIKAGFKVTKKVDFD